MKDLLLVAGGLLLAVALLLATAFLVIVLPLLFAWGPAGIASLFLRRRLRRLGHEWVSPTQAAHLATALGIRAWMIPRYDDAGSLPGFEADPVRFLIEWVGGWSPS